jgi:hypothetical protein
MTNKLEQQIQTPVMGMALTLAPREVYLQEREVSTVPITFDHKYLSDGGELAIQAKNAREVVEGRNSYDLVLTGPYAPEALHLTGFQRPMSYATAYTHFQNTDSYEDFTLLQDSSSDSRGYRGGRE